MKEKEPVTLTTFVLMVLSFAVIVPGIILSGYVLTILWGWFILPAFGLAVPSIPIMLGLSLIISYLTYQNIYVEETRTPTQIFTAAILSSIGRPLITLGIGWIIHQYV